MTPNNDTGRPWMTALEMQFAALNNAVATNKSGLSKTTVPALTEASRLAARFLPNSETYAWTKDTTTAVLLAARSVPEDAEISSSILPSPAFWWWFDTPFPFSDGEDEKEEEGDDELDFRHIVAISVGVFADGDISVVVYRWWSTARSPAPVTSLRIPANTVLRTAKTNVIKELNARLRESMKRSYDLIRFVVAACAWLQQRILTVSSGHIERHRRKQLAREHNAPMPSDVKVIQLRRAESQSHPPTANGEVVDWSCRWIVGGHWRNQPYKDERKLIYIMPYVKGPADMPLKVPTHTVYQVNR